MNSIVTLSQSDPARSCPCVVTDAKIDIDNGLKFESYSSCFLRQ